MSKAAILDASALLAVLGDEPGGELVAPLLDGGVVSTVNWSEVLARYVDLGLETAGREAEIESLGVSLAPFTSRQSEVAAGLLPLTRKAGLSLGDRACLALRTRRRRPAGHGGSRMGTYRRGPGRHLD